MKITSELLQKWREQAEKEFNPDVEDFLALIDAFEEEQRLHQIEYEKYCEYQDKAVELEKKLEIAIDALEYCSNYEKMNSAHDVALEAIYKIRGK